MNEVDRAWWDEAGVDHDERTRPLSFSLRGTR